MNPKFWTIIEAHKQSEKPKDRENKNAKFQSNIHIKYLKILFKWTPKDKQAAFKATVEAPKWLMRPKNNIIPPNIIPPVLDSEILDQSPWNNKLVDVNNSIDLGVDEGVEGEFLDRLSHYYKKPIKIF